MKKSHPETSLHKTSEDIPFENSNPDVNQLKNISSLVMNALSKKTKPNFLHLSNNSLLKLKIDKNPVNQTNSTIIPSKHKSSLKKFKQIPSFNNDQTQAFYQMDVGKEMGNLMETNPNISPKPNSSIFSNRKRRRINPEYLQSPYHHSRGNIKSQPQKEILSKRASFEIPVEMERSIFETPNKINYLNKFGSPGRSAAVQFNEIQKREAAFSSKFVNSEMDLRRNYSQNYLNGFSNFNSEIYHEPSKIMVTPAGYAYTYDQRFRPAERSTQGFYMKDNVQNWPNNSSTAANPHKLKFDSIQSSIYNLPFTNYYDVQGFRDYQSDMRSVELKKKKYSKCKLCCLNIIKNFKQKSKLTSHNNMMKQNSQLENHKMNSKNSNSKDQNSLDDDKISLISQSEIQNAKNKAKNYKVFSKPFILMVKLLCDDEIENEDLAMGSLQKELVIEFMRKKKLCKTFEMKDFNATTLKTLRENENARRTEERLKFVFKKCIRYIQNRFKKKEMRRNKDMCHYVGDSYSDSVNFDYKFYGHYYEQIAKEINQPIEKFFHFRNWKNRTSDHIPKSITKVYVNYLKMNSKFMNLFIKYMNDKLIMDVTLSNIKKVSRLVEDWEMCVKKEGQDKGTLTILNKFKAKGLKLPWGLNEVRNAIKDTLGYILKD